MYGSSLIQKLFVAICPSSFYVVVMLVQIVTFSELEFLSLQELNHILSIFLIRTTIWLSIQGTEVFFM